MKAFFAAATLLLLCACSPYQPITSLSIQASVANPAEPGSTVTFTVYQQIYGGSTFDVTAHSTLTSSDSTVAAIVKGKPAVATTGYGGSTTIKATYSGQSATLELVVTPAPTINAWGDDFIAGKGASSTSDAMVAVLGADLQRSVANYGISGQGSTQVAMRQGGVATQISVGGGEIPPAATADVSAINNIPLAGLQTAETPDYRFLSTCANDSAISEAGTLGGVSGQMTRTASGGGTAKLPCSSSETYTFTQAAGGMLQDIQPEAAFVPDTAATRDQVNIIWSGRNNYTDESQVLADIAAMVAYLNNDNYLVLSILNGSGEGSGTAAYQAIADLNTKLSQTYGDKYLDVREALVKSYSSASAQDQSDYADDIVPTSLRADAIHLNNKGYGIAATTVEAAVTAQHY